MYKGHITHHMRLAALPFGLISSGRKTVEVRLYDEKRRRLALGDRIEFTLSGSDKRIVMRVIGLRQFDTFSELYSSDVFDKCGCDGMTVDQAVHYIYGYYSQADETKYGALAIELEPIL